MHPFHECSSPPRGRSPIPATWHVASSLQIRYIAHSRLRGRIRYESKMAAGARLRRPQRVAAARPAWSIYTVVENVLSSNIYCCRYRPARTRGVKSCGRDEPAAEDTAARCRCLRAARCERKRGPVSRRSDPPHAPTPEPIAPCRRAPPHASSRLRHSTFVLSSTWLDLTPHYILLNRTLGAWNDATRELTWTAPALKSHDPLTLSATVSGDAAEIVSAVTSLPVRFLERDREIPHPSRQD